MDIRQQHEAESFVILDNDADGKFTHDAATHLNLSILT